MRVLYTFLCVSSFKELDLVAPGVAEAWLRRVAQDAAAAGLPLLVIGVQYA